MSRLRERLPDWLEWWGPTLLLGFLLILVLPLLLTFTMGAATIGSDTSGPYSNGDQRITDLSNVTAVTLTVPDRTQMAMIQAIGGVVYFAHDGAAATVTDFQIASGDVLTYDGDVTKASVLAAGADIDVNVLYFR